MRSHLTTHILDATGGTPATGVDVSLTGPDGTPVARGATDDDGRLALGPESLPPGNYTLTFATGSYFRARGVDAFYPLVSISFTIADGPHRHYHVPLLLSPFAYSTYRGS